LVGGFGLFRRKRRKDPKVSQRPGWPYLELRVGLLLGTQGLIHSKGKFQGIKDGGPY